MLYEKNHRDGLLGIIVRLSQKFDCLKTKSNSFISYIKKEYSMKMESKLVDLIRKDKKILSKLKKDLTNSYILASTFNSGLIFDEEKIQKNKLLYDLYFEIYENGLTVSQVLNKIKKLSKDSNGEIK